MRQTLWPILTQIDLYLGEKCGQVLTGNSGFDIVWKFCLNASARCHMATLPGLKVVFENWLLSQGQMDICCRLFIDNAWISLTGLISQIHLICTPFSECFVYLFLEQISSDGRWKRGKWLENLEAVEYQLKVPISKKCFWKTKPNLILYLLILVFHHLNNTPST